ncbi:hypothetical protein PHYSODRAFT_305946 [Phytophthora sojae]|uniref:EGF-like domain-containing protein n=1 Tax=Phytophthora sojae (strain P6497) TaxID=1094619 RepID=G5A7C1_PHYSP|nr:hypothetical protein PHYSODRAFT_305946 [Phytophthora sojae]EGZ09226.1 hypothetical protein PHYSODRAFT_305946 [Phytophthora sojae]|eukprot:XP_009535859.1 hypothetical protein PHYSODRAFT_305946 [Phytophthora sojae]
MTKWWFVAVLTALLATPSLVLGACPNKCSGHGKCDLNDVCDCMQNWIGGDCSGRQCPFTRAWHDTAQRDDDAHYYAECANRGSCDRSTGECACDAGFVGSGCRRMQCPNDCSGHGTCEFIEELAGDNFHKRIQGVSGRKYSLWDQEKIMGCVCDANYEGHDCSLRTCPKGDDPLTPNQKDMVQAIKIKQSGGSGYLTYHDPYGNAYTTEKITFGAAAGTNDDTTCANIQQALRRLPNNVLNGVTVSAAASFYSFLRTDPTDPKGYGTVLPIYYSVANTAAATQDSVICEVVFNSEPGGTGYQNMLECNVALHTAVGQHPVSGVGTGSCEVFEVYADADVVAGSIISATTVVQRPLTELAECSGRGTCDYSTGACTCFAGHMGLACESQEALV